MRSAAVVSCVLYAAACTALQCAQRRELSPCTCRRDSDDALVLLCERVDSYARVALALKGKLPPRTHAELQITHSELGDLAEGGRLADLGPHLTKLKLNYDNISEISDEAFVGLESVRLLSLADNEMSLVPRHVLHRMPNIRTLDLGWSKIKALHADDLKPLPNLSYLILGGNQMTYVERDSMPPEVRHLHIGRNRLTSLNGTLRHLDSLEWLLINDNELTTIEGELPTSGKMKLIVAAANKIEALPKELLMMPALEKLYIYENKIKSLNGVLSKAHRLETLNLSYNQIKHLARDDFTETSNLTNLDLGCNLIVSLNGSLRNLSLLKYLNLTQNKLGEFSLQEIAGLKKLVVLDLSRNWITHLSGASENTVEVETVLLELRLSYNKLRTLGGALVGLHDLIKLNVSHNLLEVITPDDLIGLDKLKVLDLSHNHLFTIEATSKACLPSLEEFHLSYNKITALEKDFHGLPVLCHADLSHNNVESINIELVVKTRCSIHGISSVLKIQLHGNPVVCEDNFPELNNYVDTLQVRFYGECAHRKHNQFTPTVVATSLLNDIPLGGELLLSSNVLPPDSHHRPHHHQPDKRPRVVAAASGRLAQMMAQRDQQQQPQQPTWQEYHHHLPPT